MVLVGHVTKEGAIAGPRVLEHIVDAVLYLEGERFQSYRLLRGQKNRFGSTNEIGLFEMRGEGMVEVTNPSELIFAERPDHPLGSAHRGDASRGPGRLLVEIQALTSPTSFSLPRRMANGVEFNRLLMLVAVMNKRLGSTLGTQDVIVSVTGGIRVEEPAADLGIVVERRIELPRRAGAMPDAGGLRRGGAVRRGSVGAPAGAAGARSGAAWAEALHPAQRQRGQGPKGGR